MAYIFLAVICLAGYILMSVGSRKEKENKLLKIVGWILMVGCCAAALYLKYGSSV